MNNSHEPHTAKIPSTHASEQTSAPAETTAPTAARASKRASIARRSLLGAGALAIMGVGGTGAWAYDRFLLEKVGVENASSLEDTTATLTTFSDSSSSNSSSSDSSTNDSSGTSTESTSSSNSNSNTTYQSDYSEITVEAKTSGSGSNALAWYVATIAVSDARVVKAAFAQDTYGENITEKPSVTADRVGAILAINGDYYGFRSTGIVIRNGVTYRDEPARDALVIFEDGSMKIIDETTTSADELVADGAWQCLSFGPAVVQDGQIPNGIDSVEVDTNFGNHSIQGNQPRTAVGQKSDGSFVFMVVDGRSEGYSRGATMSELGQLLIDEGCTVAYNLDGGGSSVMFFQGEMVSKPRGGNEDRATSDILYIAQ